MKKQLLIHLLILTALLLAACTESEAEDENQIADESNNSEGRAVDPDSDLESLIGKQIEMTEDGSIQLPFDDQVLTATFSEDGQIKFFNFNGYMILVEGEEIIHADKATNDYHVESDEIALSADGKFATWRSPEDEFDIHVYDIENREKHVVGKDGDKDPYDLFQPWLIEEHDGIHYLMTNDYWAALGHGTVLDLNHLELIYDRDKIATLTPDEPIEDDDKYHELKAEAAILGMEDGMYSPYGYYKYFYTIDEPGEDEDTMNLKQFYGGDTANSVLKEIRLEDMEFGTDEIRVMNFRQLDIQQIQVADNGLYIIPVVDGDVEENDYHLRIYIADLTEDSPVTATLLTETEVTDERPSIFFNEDETAIYLSQRNVMEKFELK